MRYPRMKYSPTISKVNRMNNHNVVVPRASLILPNGHSVLSITNQQTS